MCLYPVDPAMIDRAQHCESLLMGFLPTTQELRDSINMLLKERIPFGDYQTISSEEMCRYVTRIAQTHSVNIDILLVGSLLTSFRNCRMLMMKDLMNTIGPFLENRMEVFVENCNKIREQIEMEIEK